MGGMARGHDDVRRVIAANVLDPVNPKHRIDIRGTAGASIITSTYSGTVTLVTWTNSDMIHPKTDPLYNTTPAEASMQNREGGAMTLDVVAGVARALPEDVFFFPNIGLKIGAGTDDVFFFSKA